jgi:hypothetical protein
MTGTAKGSEANAIKPSHMLIAIRLDRVILPLLSY